MNITYIKLFVDYLDAIEPLGDAERGRLFTALLQYARLGEAPQLGGNERFLFPMMRAQIDRDVAEMAEKMEHISGVRSEAGRKGGYQKQVNASKDKQTLANQANASKPSKDKQTLANLAKDEDKRQTTNDNRQSTKTNDEDEAPPTPPQGDSVAAAVVSDYLNRINAKASQTSLEELSHHAKTLGEAVCLRAFDVALDNKAATWPYIRGILRRLQAQGVRCLADWDALEARRDADRDTGGAPTANPGTTRDGWRAKYVNLDGG